MSFIGPANTDCSPFHGEALTDILFLNDSIFVQGNVPDTRTGYTLRQLCRSNESGPIAALYSYSAALFCSVDFAICMHAAFSTYDAHFVEATVRVVTCLR